MVRDYKCSNSNNKKNDLSFQTIEHKKKKKKKKKKNIIGRRKISRYYLGTGTNMWRC